MSEIEEKIKCEILLKELVKDPWLAHCFVKIEDSEKLYCRAYLGIACRDKARPGDWGRMPVEYRTAVAAFTIETIWPQLSEERRGEWLDLTEKWLAPIYKQITAEVAVKAFIGSEDIKTLARELGVTYNVAYKTIRPKLGAFEAMEKLKPLFDTRTPHQKTLPHLSEPRRVYESQILRCTGYISRGGGCDEARAAFYEWYDPESGEYPDFSEAALAARYKARMDYFDEHGTMEGFRHSVP